MIESNEYFIEHHPWKHYIPEGAKTLIIGTFPPSKKNWSFNFFYPNKRNLFWKILAFINVRQLQFDTGEEAVIERKQLLIDLKIGVTDMGLTIERFKESSLDETLVLIQAMDIFKILNEYPSIQNIILTSSNGPVNALRWFVNYLAEKSINVVIPKGKKPISFTLFYNKLTITAYALYSPSPRAANRIGFSELVGMYRDVIK